MTSSRAPRPEASASVLRWKKWQESRVSQRLLTAEERALGYTVVRVPPRCRDSFLEVLYFLHAYSEYLDRSPGASTVDALWYQVGEWARRLTAAVQRLSNGKAITPPPPVEFPDDYHA